MARRSVNRSASTGRFVSKASAARWPTKTITERVGVGTSNRRSVTRSATTGRFVTSRWGDQNPDGTIRQRV
ncbi:ABC transporter ATP-binding protein [Corynebacterium diphtheriae]|nr:ABC transporter ATP-binding protein [Corynebacterium diphtheriae]OSQ12050.1 ABC transporter ATP-binding protein [Corynebacterium diphtheriae]OSQ20522.1 ABC transporter ATP-binding protein [Corynebacterium diphtheriae]OWX93831.1 ABC transporter ATP-binding protein [Corynebacterium diphtheriae]